MSKHQDYIWIDDNSERQQAAVNIEASSKANVKFINVKGKGFIDALQSITHQDTPDLILIDHNLQYLGPPHPIKGSSIAEILREKWPTTPIVCITAASALDIGIHKIDIYDAIFDISNISSNYATLESIAESFRKLSNSKIEDVRSLLAFLMVPQDDEDRIIAILPKLLKENFSDSSLPQRFSRWVNNTLIAKPGFLFDRLWAATLIGLNEDAFTKVEYLFEDAKYNGIFSAPDNEHWWKTGLQTILAEHAKDTELIYPWEQGRKLPGIHESDYSKCYASGDDHPETVAYTDETEKKRAPMCLKYTIPYPRSEESLFFEEIRMMQGSK